MNIQFLIRTKPRLVLTIIGLYLLATAIAFGIFSILRSGPTGISPEEVAEKKGTIDLSAPKTEECPLNGQMYTKAEGDIWSGRRPLGVMVENHVDSRPQSGLSRADIVYEAVAEGGVTRFLAIFFCGASADEVQIGPVRSARTYFMDWVSEYGDYPLYAHVGGANKPGKTNALGQIGTYGWSLYNDLNQFSIGFPTFWRDYERLGRPVATEHTMYTTGDKLWEVAAGERELSNKNEDGDSWDEEFEPWTFADGAASSDPAATKVSFPFWDGYGDFAVDWEYDAAANNYKRVNGGEPFKDLNDDSQVTASNVVVMFTRVRGPLNELQHMLYTTTGSGKALVFQNGDVVEANWKKKTRTDRTVFTDKKGAEISFARGPIWIEVLQTGTDVEY